MILLKNNLTMNIFNTKDEIQDNDYNGIYYNDTRFFADWKWSFENKCIKTCEEIIRFETVKQFWSVFTNHTQQFSIERAFTVLNLGIKETLKLRNYNITDIKDSIKLNVKPNFMDMMYIRNNAGFSSNQISDYKLPKCSYSLNNNKIIFEAEDQTGFKYYAYIELDCDFKFDGEYIEIEYCLQKNSSKEINIKVELQDDYDIVKTERPKYEEFESRFNNVYNEFPELKDTIKKSIESVYALMSNYDGKWIITAGMPIFAVPFGRDSLIAAYFLLPYIPEITRDTLLFLGENIGNKKENFNQEEIGKIGHEFRRGELSRRRLIPFEKYYGTADATSLYIIILYEYVESTKNYQFIEETKDIWEKALQWIESKITDNYMISFYNENDMGLSVQSWKDSADSMCHKDGSMASAPLYVSEVQGYTYKACLAVSKFYDYLKDKDKSEKYYNMAQNIYKMLDNYFWNEKLQTYAMALDCNLKQLEVLSSDAGHILWSEAVDKDRAKMITNNLLKPEMFTGFGIRTLSTKSASYNPNSYHNGSVWSHDTMICALGMYKYNFKEEAKKISNAILNASKYWGLYSLPELFSGYENNGIWNKPIPYPEACQLQAWSSSSIFACLKIISDR